MRSAIKRCNRTSAALSRQRWSSSTVATEQQTSKAATTEGSTQTSDTPTKSAPKKKTQAQLDEELQQKLAAMAGDGGDAGVEYEDGKPVSMKRGVRENMFRYI